MAEKTKAGDGIMETVKTVFWALIIAGVFRTLFFQPFWIPTGSMKDTLLIGDFLFVNKMAYGYSKHSCPFSACPISGRIWAGAPERGDVVVFRHPVSGADFVKRLIGLPGDRIQVTKGQLIVNGTPYSQEDGGLYTEIKQPQGSQGTEPACSNAPVGQGGTCEKQRLIETDLNGKSYSTLDVRYLPNRHQDETKVYVVPEGEYFFMGDNRDNSQDSRVSQQIGGVGFVPYENLIGRVDRVMFSSAGRSLFYFWTWRGDRFFHKVE
ncbi:signal peptidase I [Oceanicola sp. D3]|uniref:signal peptidase I n=1 Tax=Oceanicola sp. D3 TaxID=2587163 RepID=UPI0011233E69|nr:signal peptidase I [Oceanicola sp. D3]QDC11071.1 signal peptidase I [Oceanicola sp. D3]